MPIFEYAARNSHQEKVTGKVEAKNQQQAVSLLAARGLFVVRVKLYTEGSMEFLNKLMNKVGFVEVVTFTRQMATMITAGLSLSKSLSILEQQPNPEMGKMVSALLKEVETGNTFSSALMKYPGQFSRVYIQLVKAGELGGVLDKVLDRLAINLEKEKEFQSKTKGALIYPIIVVTAMAVVGIIMMIFVVPKLTAMYKDFGAKMPMPTMVLMSISDFFVNSWWAVALAAAGAYFGFKSWQKTRKGQIAFEKFIFKLPIFGDLRKKIIVTDFARTLSLLLSTGVSLLEALDIVSEAADSLIYREAFQEAARMVEKGDSLSQAIARYGDIFPSILNQMLAVGEETGKLDDVLQKLSVFFEAETEQAVKNMTTAMEPMIMVVLGLGVGMLVIAVILPIYSLTSAF